MASLQDKASAQGLHSSDSADVAQVCTQHLYNAPVEGDDRLDPIAIVGMSCRFPGDGTNPDRFWEMVASKQSAWCEVPKDRFNVEAFYHPDTDRNGSVSNPNYN